MIKKVVSISCLFLTLLILTACQANMWGTSELLLSGVTKNMSAQLTPFDAISIHGPFDVDFKFVPGHYSLRTQGDSALLDKLSYFIKDNTLYLTMSQEFEYPPQVKMMVVIEVPELKRLHYRGPGKIALLNLETDHLILDGEGSGFFYMTGIAARLDVSLSGTSRLDARCLKTRATFVNAVGLARADVATDGAVSVLAAESGDVYYYNNPLMVTDYQNQSGSVMRMDGIAKPSANVPEGMNKPGSLMQPAKKLKQATS
jgi:hypothetical protein